MADIALSSLTEADAPKVAKAVGDISGVVSGDEWDKILTFMDKLDKLANSPLGQTILRKYQGGEKQEPSEMAFRPNGEFQEVVMKTETEVIGIVPASDTHKKIFEYLNQMSEMALIKKAMQLKSTGVLDDEIGGEES